MAKTGDNREQSERFLEFFEGRGISDEVRRARGYEEHVDAETTRSFFEVDGFTTVQKRDLSFMVGWLDGAAGRKRENADDPGGIIIRRWAPPGHDPMQPELRPWKDFPGKTITHYHGSRPPGKDWWPTNSEGKRLSRRQILTPEQAQRHIDSAKGWHGGNGERGSGTNSEEVHTYDKPAKYRHLVAPIVKVEYRHTHEEMRRLNPRLLRRHLRDEHAEGPILGDDESHPHDKWRKGRGDAARIDVHPLALPRFTHAKRVYFGIEGCPKADAILTYILAHNRSDETVCSVPACAQWLAPELDDVALQYWIGKEIIICPDADWVRKPEVLTQALLDRSYLRHRLHLDAEIYAPPLDENGELLKDDDDNELKGHDDFLAAGYGLDDLVRIYRAPPVGLLLWLHGRLKCGRTELRYAERTLSGLIIHAGQDGSFWASLGMLSKVMRTSTRKVDEALKRLLEVGAIKQIADDEGKMGPLGVVQNRWGFGWEWEGRTPWFEILSELRQPLEPPQRLGDRSSANGPAPGLQTVPEVLRDEDQKWAAEQRWLGRSHKDIARELGKSTRTIQEWLPVELVDSALIGLRTWGIQIQREQDWRSAVQLGIDLDLTSRRINQIASTNGLPSEDVRRAVWIVLRDAYRRGAEINSAVVGWIYFNSELYDLFCRAGVQLAAPTWAELQQPVPWFKDEDITPTQALAIWEELCWF